MLRLVLALVSVSFMAIATSVRRLAELYGLSSDELPIYSVVTGRGDGADHRPAGERLFAWMLSQRSVVVKTKT